MDYLTFAKQLPVLYGQILVKNKPKIGSFKPVWDHLTNSMMYWYYTPTGRKGKGGFTFKRAYALLNSGRLYTDPERGKPENYI